MTIISDTEISMSMSSPPRVKARILEQMAEALEDEAGGLYRRAAAFEEEETRLNSEIGERQTEISRLLLKLEAMQAERNRVMEKIDLISHEASLIRDRVFSSEEDGKEPGTLEANDSASNRCYEAGPRAGFFRRAMLPEQVPHA